VRHSFVRSHQPTATPLISDFFLLDFFTWFVYGICVDFRTWELGDSIRRRRDGEGRLWGLVRRNRVLLGLWVSSALLE
jgi:hypothetical protein